MRALPFTWLVKTCVYAPPGHQDFLSNKKKCLHSEGRPLHVQFTQHALLSDPDNQTGVSSHLLSLSSEDSSEWARPVEGK